MRIFDEKSKCCHSSLCLEGVKYTLTKQSAKEGTGVIFSVEEPNRDSDSILITMSALKALYLLITSNEEKK